jgi:hypothetical protein
MTDNGPQFSSEEFHQFSVTWEFEHKTSSPHFPQSNGKVENAVKTAKSLMKKAKEDRKDPYLALLDWRNTPSEGLGSSPAQRLLGRRTKTLLPVAGSLLKPKATDGVTKTLALLRSKQARYFNRGAKELPVLNRGSVLRMKPTRMGDSHWKKAVCIDQVGPRSYIIESNGARYRRNRRHLVETKETDVPLSQTELDCTSETVPAKPEIGQPTETPVSGNADMAPAPACAELKTSSGRVIRPPKRYQDYV